MPRRQGGRKLTPSLVRVARRYVQSIVGDPELAGLCRIEEQASLFDIRVSDENFHRSQAIEREAVRVPQRFSTHRRRNAPPLEERADLARVNLAVRDEHAPKLVVHETPPQHNRLPAAAREGNPAVRPK